MKVNAIKITLSVNNLQHYAHLVRKLGPQITHSHFTPTILQAL